MDEPAGADPGRSASIVGAGQAGAALGFGFVRIGIPVKIVNSRSHESARELARRLGATTGDLARAIDDADLILLSTPDDALASVVASIAQRRRVDGKRFLHCSGINDLEVLAPLRERGGEIGVLHPVTPLVPPDEPATLVGKPMGCEADDSRWVESLAVRLGGRVVSLAGVPRPLYHAAASMSASLVVAMAATAVRAFGDAGVSESGAELLVGSLLTATAANVATHGPLAALTGPVRRGDDSVVRSHIHALGEVDPALAETYRIVSQRILDMMAPGDAYERVSAALAGPVGRHESTK